MSTIASNNLKRRNMEQNMKIKENNTTPAFVTGLLPSGVWEEVDECRILQANGEYFIPTNTFISSSVL